MVVEGLETLEGSENGLEEAEADANLDLTGMP